jgi:hypothetical protein
VAGDRLPLATFFLGEEFEEWRGLPHLRMAAIAHRLQEAKVATPGDTYQRGMALAHELWRRLKEAPLNALNVSFLENLDFDGPRGPIAWGCLTSELQQGWKAMQAYLHRLTAPPQAARKSGRRRRSR